MTVSILLDSLKEDGLRLSNCSHESPFSILGPQPFKDKWIGNKNFSKGERDNIEMKMCFGNEKEPDFFLGNNNFDQLSYRLYGPLIKALKK